MSAQKAFAKVTPDGKKWGMIDIQGNYVLEPIFETIHDWREGIVSLEKVPPDHYDEKRHYKSKLNGQFGFMNIEGELITDFSFGDAEHFSEGLAGVSNGEKWGFINKKGALVIPYRFSEIGRFCDNMCYVRENRKWGIINPQGDWVLENRYDSLSNFDYGMAFVTVKKKRFLIDFSGNIISTLPYKYNYMEVLSQKLIAFGWIDYHFLKTHYGLMDIHGDIKYGIQFCKSDRCFAPFLAFHNGQLIVENEDGMQGIVNEEGILIVPLGQHKETHSSQSTRPVSPTNHPFDELRPYSEGLAIARKDTLWGVVDENHHTVVDFKFQSRPRWITDGQGIYFSEDYPTYAYGLINIDEVKDGNVRSGYMDKQGNIAIDLKFRKTESFFGNNEMK